MPRRPLIIAIVLLFFINALFPFVFDFYRTKMIYARLPVKVNNNRTNETFSIEDNILLLFENLAQVYRIENPGFKPILTELRNGLNASGWKREPLRTLWDKIKKWPNKESVFPAAGKELALVISALKSTRITNVKSAKGGSQLKLMLTLEGNQNAIFKPKRYENNHIITKSVRTGSDRHNSEVLGFLLALLLDIRLAPVSVIRQIHLKNDVMVLGTDALKETIVSKDNRMCIYGECRFCKKMPACADEKSGYLEGAAILVLKGSFIPRTSPWEQTREKKLVKWQRDPKYCIKVEAKLSLSHILDLVDAAIFDFLLQNDDRHHYETFKERVLLWDNGKGLRNPNVDVIDLLAPLYQCCVLRNSTWERLLLLSGNSLSYSVKTLEKFVIQETDSELTTNLQLYALDRRLLKVYATVLYCLETKGPSHVFKL